ncbi:putative lipoprotein YerH [Paraliobacillus quinghaiensis]|uniref:Lipoprotein YerH n=1 Tax=Paraliobacillus quinghaiensis TaxID=470815 RepID=A0A917TNM7_9BACI|nr:CamS family sex pheromone protein [Paraliobacillus quinghaiensis]GGM29039.1 putative lipoprotein YerH [Paraliobacillus quinghaiensis]
MNKNIIPFLLILLLILTSCAPSFENQDEVVEDSTSEETGTETAIIPRYSVSDQDYQVLLPYKLSQSRGVIVNQVANRLDIGAFEEGLRRHSTDVFNPDDYYFQEGQKITSDIVYEWLERYSEDDEGRSNPLGLNPEIEGIDDDEFKELNDDEKKIAEKRAIEAERNNPKYLSHILEQDYLIKSDDNSVQLAGISIGIAMKSHYRFVSPKGLTYYEDIDIDTMLSEANRVAKEVVNRLRAREELAEVPIMIAVYREAARNDLVPGNFVRKATVEGGSTSIGEWQAIDEEYVLFPSNEAEDKDPDMAANLDDFKKDIADYFPNYVGVIGKGFYIDDQLQKLTLEIPVQFSGKAEVNGFTQYVYGLVMEGFQNHFDLEINITSSDKQESLIFRKASNDEPTVHIYN